MMWDGQAITNSTSHNTHLSINKRNNLSRWIVESRKNEPVLLRRTASFSDKDIFKKLEIIGKFKTGQSNPTFLFRISAGDNAYNPNFHAVLRRKPNSIAHPSAHALHREFRVLKKLQKHNEQIVNCRTDTNYNQIPIPIPYPYSYCNDKNVIGSEFYIMEFVSGRIFTDSLMHGMTKHDRRRAFEDVMSVMANLHSIDIENVGLGSYGKGGKYVQRQLNRLLAVSRKQAELSNTPNVPQIEKIANQLEKYAGNCPNRISLLHGDFKIDNIVFHPREPKVIALLDWEMSTVGDPLVDLANLSVMYLMPQDSNAAISGVAGVDFETSGVPTKKDLFFFYCERSKSTTLDEIQKWIGFYLAFVLFKYAVIIQGIAQRAKDGVASNERADEVAKNLPFVCMMAQSILDTEVKPESISRL